MYMIFYVLNDPQKLDALLDAWDAIGISGATIVESTGRQRRRVQKTHIPMRFSFGLGGSECVDCYHYTLFAIVEDERLVQQCIEATERVVGDLGQPDTGILAAWPLAAVKGIPKQPRKAEER
ncbi:MAG: hypothetical protein QHH80_02775 [Anaerolineae bacterium]|jgi:nitrogen regulatory protein PII|nr:hypothetical protein [Anaerolineae bacterium]